MKSIKFISAIYALFVISCSGGADSHNHEAVHEQEQNEHEHEHQDGAIVIDPEDAERLGILTAEIYVTPVHESIPVTGQITTLPSGTAVISATGPGIVTLSETLSPGKKVSAGQQVARVSAQGISGGDPNAAARVAMNAAKQEVERLTPLVAEGIVTRREYNAAVAAYEAARAVYSPKAASGSLTSPITGVVTAVNVSTGQYVEAGTIIATVAKSDKLLLRLDIPEMYRANLSEIEDAEFRAPQSDTWLTAKTLGGTLTDAPGGAMPVNAGYIPVYFKISNTDGVLAAGTYVEANVLLSVTHDGVSIPAEALSEQYGNYFVYLKTGDHEYQKQKVTVGTLSGSRATITSGLSGGQIIVVKGVSAVKLSESSGAAPEGHTHNH